MVVRWHLYKHESEYRHLATSNNKADSIVNATVLKALANVLIALGWYDGSVSGASGYDIRTLAAAHIAARKGRGCTHAEASELATAFYKAAKSTHTLGAAPQIHYASASGGIHSKFRHKGSDKPNNYHPELWWHKWARPGAKAYCDKHKTDYAKCSPLCHVSARVGSKTLYAILGAGKGTGPAAKGKAKAKPKAAPKATANADAKAATETANADAEKAGTPA